MTQQDIEEGDARQEPRSGTLKGAVIVPANGKPEIRCLITNISGEGAELRLEGHDRAPPRFELRVPHQAMSYRAEVRWRDEGRIGVAFNGAEAMVKPKLKVV